MRSVKNFEADCVGRLPSPRFNNLIDISQYRLGVLSLPVANATASLVAVGYLNPSGGSSAAAPQIAPRQLLIAHPRLPPPRHHTPTAGVGEIRVYQRLFGQCLFQNVSG